MVMGNTPDASKIDISPGTLRNLNTLRKWTMFLSVTGFIFLGLIIILGILTGTFFTAFNQSNKIPGIPDLLVIAAFAGVALIDFFPIFFLYRFSKHLADFVTTQDRKSIHHAIRDIKRFFIFIGILVILLIAGYFSSLLFTGIWKSFLQGI
ncbi:MAG: hypothetical protein IPJ37_18510 [Bacteroidales bacterium]|nr:hypothetical protein [Bacteroidales bacterium]